MNLIEFDTIQANISLALSQYSYCGKSNYLEQTYSGVLEGFMPTQVISDIKNDVEGFIGFFPQQQSIYIVFRGSSSIRNWITDLDVVKTEYLTFPNCLDCSVHAGFYGAVKSVLPQILRGLKQLRQIYPDYQVRTTGHSLGAALAQLVSMELMANDINSSMINFGQPRIGNQEYANFSTNLWPDQFRVVHAKDIVPHIPVIEEPFLFWHSAREEWEYEPNKLKQCNDSGEDYDCSDQFLIFSVQDHLTYLGMCIGSDCGICPGRISTIIQ